MHIIMETNMKKKNKHASALSKKTELDEVLSSPLFQRIDDPGWQGISILIPSDETSESSKPSADPRTLTAAESLTL
jgi:hypothetical protein